MDPITLVILGIVFIPGLSIGGFLIYRFRQNHKSHLRSFKAEEISAKYDSANTVPSQPTAAEGK